MSQVVLFRPGLALAVHWLSGRPWYTVDTRSWRLARDSGTGFPWWTLSFAALPLAAAGALVLLRRRRRSEELEQELAELLRIPEREVVV